MSGRNQRTRGGRARGIGCDRERKGETAGVGKDERDGERRGRGHEMVQKRKRK